MNLKKIYRINESGACELGNELGIGAASKYYYCHGCKKFHGFDAEGHKVVNRRLCFYCGETQSKKTKIIGNNEDGRSQICPVCLDKYGLI